MQQEQTQELERKQDQKNEAENEKVELFLSSVKSQETKEKYSIYLKKYMELQGLTDKDLDKETDPRVIEKQLIHFVNAMKKKGMSYIAIKNYTTAVFSFYSINDINLNTRKIAKFMPENKKVKNDRGYKREEIAKLLEFADLRARVIILLLASSGARVGAITSLKVRHLDADNHNKVIFYQKSPEEYFSFITPEAKKAVDAYLDMRKRHGEELTPDSYLIREQYDIRNPFAIKSPKAVSSEGLQWILRDLVTRYNVISNNQTPVAHGFRYWWMGQAVKCKMNPEQREMLLGHKIGLASAYYRPDPDELYVEYEKALDLLTIDPTQKLQKKLDVLEVEKTDYEKLDAKIDELARKFYSNNVIHGHPDKPEEWRPMTEKDVEEALGHSRTRRKLRRSREKELLAELEKLRQEDIKSAEFLTEVTRKKEK
ncbi:MAG: site-specific integrase [Nitrososphaeraceae archaeon]